MSVPAGLVLAACFVTVLEFPLWFAHVVASDPLGVALLAVRNGLLVVAALAAARVLWRATVPKPTTALALDQADHAEEASAPPESPQPNSARR